MTLPEPQHAASAILFSVVASIVLSLYFNERWLWLERRRGADADVIRGMRALWIRRLPASAAMLAALWMVASFANYFLELDGLVEFAILAAAILPVILWRDREGERIRAKF